MHSLEDMFSDQQAITEDAVSTNVVDLLADRDVGKGEPVGILVQVTEDFNTLTSLAITLETDTTAAFGSPTTLYTETIVLANLTAGARLWLKYLGENNERYLRLDYNVTGTDPTTGKITAALIRQGDRQNWQSYADNVTIAAGA